MWVNTEEEQEYETSRYVCVVFFRCSCLVASGIWSLFQLFLALVMQGGSDGGLANVGTNFEVRGWVRTVRNQKAFAFIEVAPTCFATTI